MTDCCSPGKGVNSLAAHANVIYPPAVARALEAQEESCEQTTNPLSRTLSSKKLLKRTLPRHLAQLQPQPLRAELLCGCLSGFGDVRGGVCATVASVRELSVNVQADPDEKLQFPSDQMPSQSQRLGIDTGNLQQPIKGPYSPVLQQRLLHPFLAAHPLPRSARATSSSKIELDRSPKLGSAKRPAVLKGLWHEGPWVLVPPAALLAEGVYNAPVVPGVLPVRHRRLRKQCPSQLPQGAQQPARPGQADLIGQPSGIAEANAEENNNPDDHAADASEPQGAGLHTSHDQAHDAVQAAMSSALDVASPFSTRPLSDAAGESTASECCDVLVNFEPSGGVKVVLA